MCPRLQGRHPVKSPNQYPVLIWHVWRYEIYIRSRGATPAVRRSGPITSACGESRSRQQRESNMSGQLMRSKIRKTEFSRLCWEKVGNSADAERSRRLIPRPSLFGWFGTKRRTSPPDCCPHVRAGGGHLHGDWERRVFYTCARSRARPTDVQPVKREWATWTERSAPAARPRQTLR